MGNWGGGSSDPPPPPWLRAWPGDQEMLVTIGIAYYYMKRVKKWKNRQIWVHRGPMYALLFHFCRNFLPSIVGPLSIMVMAIFGIVKVWPILRTHSINCSISFGVTVSTGGMMYFRAELMGYPKARRHSLGIPKAWRHSLGIPLRNRIRFDGRNKHVCSIRSSQASDFLAVRYNACMCGG